MDYGSVRRGAGILGENDAVEKLKSGRGGRRGGGVISRFLFAAPGYPACG